MRAFISPLEMFTSSHSILQANLLHLLHSAGNEAQTKILGNLKLILQ